jgi:hypothetical protein
MWPRSVGSSPHYSISSLKWAPRVGQQPTPAGRALLPALLTSKSCVTEQRPMEWDNDFTEILRSSPTDMPRNCITNKRANLAIGWSRPSIVHHQNVANEHWILPTFFNFQPQMSTKSRATSYPLPVGPSCLLFWTQKLLLDLVFRLSFWSSGIWPK